MWKQWIRLACLVGMLGGSIGATAQVEQTPNTAQLETVLVTGTQLGPGLWTVRKGDHVMYVLGIQSPIPKRMQWYSEDVLNTVANSQALLAPPSAQFSGIGFFRGLTLLPSLFRARENPDDKTLQEIVPPELYARWQSLKAKYLPRSRKVEHWRPIFAGFKLYDEAIKESGLRTDTGVWKAVRKHAKKHDVTLIEPTVELTLSEPKDTLKAFAQGELNDIECFDRTLQRLETDLEAMRARANAWAVGDIEMLRELPYPDNNEACRDALLNAAISTEKGFDQIPAQVRDVWLDAAEKAIDEHPQSFAVLSIQQLLAADSYLDALAARGYVVEAPE